MSGYNTKQRRALLAFLGEHPDELLTARQMADALAEKQIRKAFEQAEKEVEDLHQRTREGIETARLEGKQIGRIAGKKYTSNKEKKYKPEILRLSKDFNGTNTDSEVMAFTGLSRGSYYKYKRELKVEIENN